MHCFSIIASSLVILRRGWELMRWCAHGSAGTRKGTMQPKPAGGLTMYVRLGAFMPDVDAFDADLFR